MGTAQLGHKETAQTVLKREKLVGCPANEAGCLRIRGEPYSNEVHLYPLLLSPRSSEVRVSAVSQSTEPADSYKGCLDLRLLLAALEPAKRENPGSKTTTTHQHQRKACSCQTAGCGETPRLSRVSL